MILSENLLSGYSVLGMINLTNNSMTRNRIQKQLRNQFTLIYSQAFKLISFISYQAMLGPIGYTKEMCQGNKPVGS